MGNFTPEQQARADALVIAGRIVNGGSVFGTNKVGGGSEIAAIMELADYIVYEPEDDIEEYDLPGVVIDEVQDMTAAGVDLSGFDTHEPEVDEVPVDVTAEVLPQEAEPTRPVFDAHIGERIERKIVDPNEPDKRPGRIGTQPSPKFGRAIRDNPQA